MSTQLPPTIDPQAAERWAAHLPDQSPWLHEEVAQRMEARLQWIARSPTRWLHWGPLQGGRQVHAQLLQRYKGSVGHVLERTQAQVRQAQAEFQSPWWQPKGWLGARTPCATTPAAPVQMLWANMALHMDADPQALIQHWHAALEVDGFLMFSCLGPDTLRELRAVYAHLGWPAPSHAFTDMHDWGDMLVHAGFAEPIMDMETLQLSYSSADALLAELRELGRNLHPQRFGAMRGRAWRRALGDALEAQLRGPDGRLTLSFEIIYGHAFKPPTKLTMQPETRVSLQDMRRSLRQIKA